MAIRIDHHHYLHFDSSAVALIVQKLNQMSQQLEELTAEVEETKGIMQSAKVLIEGFAAALAAAGTDPVKLAALKDELNTGSESLAAAIAANPLPGDTPPGE